MNIKEWLLKHDLEFWATRTTVTQAKKLLPEPMKAREFKAARDQYCVFWKKITLRKPTLETEIDEKQWAKLAAFLVINWKFLKDQPDHVIVALARLRKVPCNKRLLRKSSTLAALRAGANLQIKATPMTTQLTFFPLHEKLQQELQNKPAKSPPTMSTMQWQNPAITMMTLEPGQEVSFEASTLPAIVSDQSGLRIMQGS